MGAYRCLDGVCPRTAYCTYVYMVFFTVEVEAVYLMLGSIQGTRGPCVASLFILHEEKTGFWSIVCFDALSFKVCARIECCLHFTMDRSLFRRCCHLYNLIQGYGKWRCYNHTDDIHHKISYILIRTLLYLSVNN